jgi:hypothetical protein
VRAHRERLAAVACSGERAVRCGSVIVDRRRQISPEIQNGGVGPSGAATFGGIPFERQRFVTAECRAVPPAGCQGIVDVPCRPLLNSEAFFGAAAVTSDADFMIMAVQAACRGFARSGASARPLLRIILLAVANVLG